MKISEIENFRKKAVAEFRKESLLGFIVTIGILLAIIVSLIITGSFKDLWDIAPIVPMVIFIPAFAIAYAFYYVWRKKKKVKFTFKIKNDLISKLIKSINPNFKYIADKIIPKESFLKSHFYNFFSYYKGEDYFTGIIDGINIEFSEVILQQKSSSNSSGGGSGVMTVFRGPFFIVKTNKNFKGHTSVVNAKRFKNIEHRVLAIIDLEKNSEIITIGNPEFDNLFKIATNNPEEAKSVLQSDLCNLLIDLSEKKIIKNTSVNFSFSENSFYLAFNGLDIFNININKPIDQQSIKRYNDEFAKYISIILEINSLIEK